MSATTIYNFDNPANWIFESSKIDISSGGCRLALEDDPSIGYLETFDSPVGFTFSDTSRAQITGGQLQVIDQRPTNSILGATYTQDFNLSWGADGFVSLSGTQNGAPAVSGGKLVCTNGSDGVYYSDSLIGNLAGDLVIKFKCTPNYNGNNGTNTNIVTLGTLTDATDKLQIFHDSTGNIRVTSPTITAFTLGPWAAVLGQEDIFEIFVISNVLSVYINNSLVGSKALVARGTAADHLYIGAYPLTYNVANASFDDVVIYSTASQTPTYSIPEKSYLQNQVKIPSITYTGPGVVQELNSFVSTEGGVPRWTLEPVGIGPFYWDGAAWVPSNETLSQTNTASEIDSFIDQFDVGALPGVELAANIYFFDSNTFSFVSNLVGTGIGQKYNEDDPTVELANPFNMEELLNFVETVIKSGNDDIKYVLKRNGSYIYHDGNDWVISDLSFLQSNTAAEIVSNASTYTTTKVEFSVVLILRTDAGGQTTPEITQLSITFDFAGETESDISICDVYFYSRNPDGTVCAEEYCVKPSTFNVRYKDNIFICQEEICKTPNSETGYIEFPLIENENMIDKDGNAVTYIVFKDSRIIGTISVPNQPGALLWDIIL